MYSSRRSKRRSKRSYSKKVLSVKKSRSSRRVHNSRVDTVVDQAIYEILKTDGMLLSSVKHQTDKMCLIAVTENGLALKYVYHQTPEICIAAVKQNGLAIEFVEHQSKEICVAAVKQISAEFEHMKRKAKSRSKSKVKSRSRSKLGSNAGTTSSTGLLHKLKKVVKSIKPSFVILFVLLIAFIEVTHDFPIVNKLRYKFGMKPTEMIMYRLKELGKKYMIAGKLPNLQKTSAMKKSVFKNLNKFKNILDNLQKTYFTKSNFIALNKKIFDYGGKLFKPAN